ncbi:hypothetical protein B0T22DRAFT_225833 [Podospora appendiculata]|uniref:Uncharacterized protein n=1 Tax=Podospora appendiculata TaxID=314037 RepID=A0AAE1CAL9_9PEZI|nr:hypothetical protein B0T22DRAFT_225833 [Podospora appendiculata]
MSSSRPNTWGTGGDWLPYTADGQPQYHTTSGAEDVGSLGRGMSDLDLGAHGGGRGHGHGHGHGQAYSHDPNYAPDGGLYAANAYTPRTFPSNTGDRNYTHAPPESAWQDHAASSSKGKARALDSTAKPKTKASREKDRERDPTKDSRISSSRKHRTKTGKSHNPVAQVEDLDPFFPAPKPPKGNGSPVDSYAQQAINDRHQPAAVAYATSEDDPRFQTPTPGDFSEGHDAYHGAADSSTSTNITTKSSLRRPNTQRLGLESTGERRRLLIIKLHRTHHQMPLPSKRTPTRRWHRQ